LNILKIIEIILYKFYVLKTTNWSMEDLKLINYKGNK
jgi:hypothetical protein